MNPVIIIPVYVSARRLTQPRSITSTFDHAVALVDRGNTERCLDSLRKVRGIGQVVLLVVAESAIASQAADKYRNIADKYSDLDILVIGAKELIGFKNRAEDLGISLKNEIGFDSYGAVHNLGLVVADVLNADAAVFIDDDEVVADAAFLENAVYGLGKLTRKGIPILAKTGFFLDADGSYQSSRSEKWYDHYLRQGEAFNEWISAAVRGPRLSRTGNASAGCLALHKEAFRRVSFDPWITRGEDADYVINLRMFGSDMWFDNRWTVHHLPDEEMNEGRRFGQDVYRWAYEYRKIEYGRAQIDLVPIKVQTLQPYPGLMLEPDTMRNMKRTAVLRYFGRSDKKGYKLAIKATKGDAAAYAERNCKNYFEFQYKWPTLMSRLAGDFQLQVLFLATRNQKQEVGETAQAASVGSVDPGATAAIRLSLGDNE